MKTSNRFPCLLLERGQAHSLYGVKVGVHPGAGLDRWLRWFPHLFVMLVLGACAVPDLLLRPVFGSWLFRNGSSFLFCLSVSIGPEFAPTVPECSYFLVPHSFFVCCSLSREAGVAVLRKRISDPRTASQHFGFFPFNPFSNSNITNIKVIC